MLPSIDLWMSDYDGSTTWDQPSFIPTLGRHTVASNDTLQTINGQSAFMVAFLSKKNRFEWDNTTPSNAGI